MQRFTSLRENRQVLIEIDQSQTLFAKTKIVKEARAY